MAGKQSKTSAPAPSIESIAAAVATPSAPVPPALAATAGSVVQKPVAPKKRVAAAPKPVAAKAATAPVKAEPEPSEPAPSVMAPSATISVPTAPVSADPEPVASVPVPTLTPPAQPVAAAAAAVVQKEAEIMETVQSATENTQARAQAMFADVNDRTKTAMEKGSKMIEEMNDFSKGNIEALVESSKIAAKGIETLGQEAAEYGRKQLESATAAMKTLSSVKSPTEFLKLHSDYMRSAFDAMVAESSKNTEAMLKLAGEIAQPISNRVALAAEKVKVAA